MVQEGMKLLSIGSESPHSVFTKIDIKDQQLRKTLGMIKIVPNFNLKRGIPLIFGKKDPFLKNGSGSNVGEKP